MEMPGNRGWALRLQVVEPMAWAVVALDWRGAITPEVTWGLMLAIRILEEDSATHQGEA
jgi:hypothetical protein